MMRDSKSGLEGAGQRQRDEPKTIQSVLETDGCRAVKLSTGFAYLRPSSKDADGRPARWDVVGPVDAVEAESLQKAFERGEIEAYSQVPGQNDAHFLRVKTSRLRSTNWEEEINPAA